MLFNIKHYEFHVNNLTIFLGGDGGGRGRGAFFWAAVLVNRYKIHSGYSPEDAFCTIYVDRRTMEWVCFPFLLAKLELSCWVITFECSYYIRRFDTIIFSYILLQLKDALVGVKELLVIRW